jgi:hypothetical protein
MTEMIAKRILLILLVFPVILSACGENGSDDRNSLQLDTKAICEAEEICSTYLDVWLEEFLHRNNMSAEYFRQHVKVNKAWINSWNSADTLIVDYTVSIAWASIAVRDHVDVLLKYNYDRLDISKDKFLTPAQISALLDGPTYTGAITPVISLEYLKFEDLNAAVEALQRAANTDAMHFNRLTYYVPGAIPHENGYPYLFAFGVLDDSANECIDGHINLSTGETDVYYTPCRID